MSGSLLRLRLQVTPVAGRSVDAELEISAAAGPCQNLCFEVWFPRGLRGVGLAPQQQVPRVSHAQPHRIRFRLAAEAAGEQVIEVRNLSFRSPQGVALSEPLVRLPVTIRETAADSEVRLACEWPAGNWVAGREGQILIALRNVGTVPLKRVTLSFQGEFAEQLHRHQELLGEVPAGAVAQVPVSAHPRSAGPARLLLLAQWLDGEGRLGEERFQTRIDVAPAVAPGSVPPPPARLLFVAAEPRTWEPGRARNTVGGGDFAETGQPGSAPGRLRLDYEFRQVRSAVLTFGDRLALEHLPAAQLACLATELLRLRPSYLHVSCHGTPTGDLCFEDDSSSPQRVAAWQLASVLQSTAPSHRCLFLNGCHTASLGAALGRSARWLIGTTHALEDTLAIAFARAFYEGVAGGLDVPPAFARAQGITGDGRLYRLLPGQPAT
jgi:hypothetical protein